MLFKQKCPIKNNINKTYHEVSLVRYIPPWDISKNISIVLIFLFSLVRVKLAKGETNLQEASKLEHKPVPKL